MKEHVNLEFTNLLSYRAKITQPEAQKMPSELLQFINKHKLEKNGPIISTTYSTKKENDKIILDCEFMIPIAKTSKAINRHKLFTLKEKIYLCNCISHNYIGEKKDFQNAFKYVINYIKENNLNVISTLFTVDNSDNNDNSLMNMDLYVSINPNKL